MVERRLDSGSGEDFRKMTIDGSGAHGVEDNGACFLHWMGPKVLEK